jgi:MerR family redox-sensitive transcriptional activator SoxR
MTPAFPAALSIGKLARLTGLAPSAIRYYEKAGLLPRAPRQSGQRRYAPETTSRLRIIRLARDAGFTIAETRTFLSGFSPDTSPAARWRSLAERKLAELDVQQTRIERMKSVLARSFRCSCPRIEDCERALAAADSGRK